MRTILGTLLVALAVAGCGSDGAADDGRPTVVAGFGPLAEAFERIGGDAIRVVNLTPPGAEPHDLELTTEQADQIEDADLVVLLGDGFQPALEEAAARRDDDANLFVADHLDLGADPHFWLDPRQMARYAELVHEEAVELATDRGPVDQGYRTFRQALTELDADYGTGLRTCDRDVFVTAHAAFGQLAKRYGLRQEAIAGLAPEQEPDPDRLADLADLVEREGVTTIFTEELVSPRVAQALAREAHVRTAVLDPIESGEDYVAAMGRNLDALREALGCQ